MMMMMMMKVLMAVVVVVFVAVAQETQDYMYKFNHEFHRVFHYPMKRFPILLSKKQKLLHRK